MASTKTTKLRMRSEHTATYLARDELDRAAQFMNLQRSRSQGGDVSGTDVEQVLAEAMGGFWREKRDNRPVPDFFDADGIAYSSKTLRLEPAVCRPRWQDWLGHQVRIPVTQCRLQGKLPKGKTPLDATPASLGKLVEQMYNQLIETYGNERLAITLRLPMPDEELTRYLYWEQAIEPLVHQDLKWKNTTPTKAAGGELVWNRSISAWYRDQDPKHSPAITWTSQGPQLWMRYRIPEDVDTWIVNDRRVLSRREGNRALSKAQIEKLGI